VSLDLADHLAQRAGGQQAGSRIGTADRLRADAELAAYARGTSVADPGAGVDDETDADADAGGDADAGADAGGDGAPAATPAATPEDLRLLAQVIVQYLDPEA
ncbi:hypothetical protein, partial [Microbacterium sp. K33]|uniref:hypothetical protein n=1 Tax=Microbacterium sp. K33 TaxID=2305441 RepID=UPI00197B65F1